jgi:hypothetical protein
MLASTARVANHPLLDHREEAGATKHRGAATGKEPSLFTRKRDLASCRPPQATNAPLRRNGRENIELPPPGGRPPGIKT